MLNQRKIQKLNNRLKGYHRHFKGRFLLLRVLKEEEFLLWDFSFSVLADWDKTHADTYGTFTQSFADIGYYFGHDRSTISKRSKRLFELDLWRKRDDGAIEVSGFNIQENLSTLTKEFGTLDLQSYVANQQLPNANTNTKSADIHQDSSKELTTIPSQIGANMHDITPKEPLVSYKDNFNNIPIKKVIIRGKVKTADEYQKIYKEGNYQNLVPEDMRWIDENITETHEVTEKNEKEMVDIFFDGDWEEYRRNTFMGTKRMPSLIE